MRSEILKLKMTELFKMSKKILVLTGSARKGGNSNRMAQACSEAAGAKGHEVKVIDTTKLKLNFCHSCQACYKTGKPCSYDYDFNTIADDILAADALVFSCPVPSRPRSRRSLIRC